MTLSGAQAGNNPNPTPPGQSSQTIIEPDPTQPDVGAVLYIGSSNVTIDGVTVDGVDLQTGNACDGIASWSNVSNILLQNNIVQHTTYAGIDCENVICRTATHVATSGNTITNNLIQDVSGDSSSGGAIGVRWPATSMPT